jgi:hypothetical protein
LDSFPAASPSQDEIDAASRRRAREAMHRCLALLIGLAAQDWRHCGKAACARSRRCRGFACEPELDGEDAPSAEKARQARRG